MDNIITLCPVKTEARVDSRLLAEHLGIQHKAVIQLVDTHKTRFERLGTLPFKMAKSGGKPTRYALLSEDQAYLLLAFSKNTDHVADLKVELVQAFSRFRQHRQTEADYLPFYHELHDQVKTLADRAHQAGSTTPERIFHVNINRAINDAFGLPSGQRPDLPGHLRAKVTAANVLALELLQEAIANGYDHKTAYRHVKQGIEAFAHAGVKRLEAA